MNRPGHRLRSPAGLADAVRPAEPMPRCGCVRSALAPAAGPPAHQTCDEQISPEHLGCDLNRIEPPSSRALGAMILKEFPQSDAVDTMQDFAPRPGDGTLLSDAHSSLLVELFAELAEPLLVVNSDRLIVFRSRAFQALVARSDCHASDQCEELLLPTPTKDGACCWSSTDSYLPEHTTGLWHLKQGAGASLPVLAELRPISFGTRRSLLALRFSPLPRLPSPVALSFFAGLHRSAVDDSTYLQSSTAYLRRMCGVGAAAWFNCVGGATPQLLRQEGLKGTEVDGLQHALAAAAPHDMQDVLIQSGRRTQVFHVLTGMRTKGLTRLAIGRLSPQLDLQTVDIARAAVCAASTGVATPVAGNGIRDQALLDMMSAAEREILHQVCRGMADKEIARARGVSLYTVKNQVKRILKKAGAHRRTELIPRFPPSR